MPSFVKIDQVVSEEKIKMRKANDDADDAQMVAIAHMTFGQVS